MENLIKAGRLNYAIGMGGLGLQQFFYPGFRPVILPDWPKQLPNPQFLIYLSSVALVALSLSIILNKRQKQTCLIAGGTLLILFILFHVPFQVVHNPANIGGWTDAFKILALSGGAFVTAGSYPYYDVYAEYEPSAFMKMLEKLIPAGSIFFSITLIVFGVDHFIYDKGVATLVPRWIPFDLFWTYFAAVALIGSGVSIILKIKLKLVGILCGIMIFMWFLILHIPRAIAMPELQNGNEITSVFEALAFSGIAFVLAFGYVRHQSET
jgi:uncharacterized membrane protein